MFVDDVTYQSALGSSRRFFPEMFCTEHVPNGLLAVGFKVE